MTEPQFTPGPWETDFFNDEDQGVYMVRDSLNQAVCQCFTQYPFAGKPGITDDEAEANANLIVAAPRMLAALEKIMETELAIAQEHRVQAEDSEIYCIAEKALRKARGENEVNE